MSADGAMLKRVIENRDISARNLSTAHPCHPVGRYVDGHRWVQEPMHLDLIASIATHYDRRTATARTKTAGEPRRDRRLPRASDREVADRKCRDWRGS